MRILAVDTTTAAGSVAVLEASAAGARLAGVVSTHSDEAYSSRLFRQLEFLLGELKLTTAEFDLFAVAAGPGTFTGLRVGLTAVKGWAEIHQKAVAAVSALEAVAHQALLEAAPATSRQEAQRRTIVPITDARRGQIYGGMYESGPTGLQRLVDDVVMTPAEFWGYLRQNPATKQFTFATTAPGFLQTLLVDSPFAAVPVAGVSSVLAPAVGEVGWQKSQRGETCDALTLDAHYVRRCDAEMMFKG